VLSRLGVQQHSRVRPPEGKCLQARHNDVKLIDLIIRQSTKPQANRASACSCSSEELRELDT
jgi:hypothetical protein